MQEPSKKHFTIGCCGIDCSLCPRFHTKGDSVCPGCGARNFRDKHPSCGLLTCCNVKKGLEVCAECADYPCSRFNPEEKNYDSFVTHKKMFSNLEYIRDNGIDSFVEQQQVRTNVLIDFLTNYDNGRSKSFFCVSCALLPLSNLLETQNYLSQISDTYDINEKNELLKIRLAMIAENFKIDLKLNNHK